MIKKWLYIFQISTSAYFMNAQTVSMLPDTVGVKLKNKTEIEILYNHYLQDGSHSAVTGGIGTEKLRVYGPSARFKRTFSKNSLDLKWDWIIISTPAWSTWSNFSNHWPILPHNSNSLVMTYLWAYEPKRHPSSIIQNTNKIILKNQDLSWSFI